MADVARLAGVSVSTVSYTLTGTRPISQATRERIERAMLELGYTPNAFARGLKSKRSKIIALLYPTHHVGMPLSSMQYVFGASDHAQELGYHLMLWTTDADAVDNLARLAGQGLVDGVLMMEIRLQDARIKVLRDARLTFTMIGRPEDPAEIDYVDSNFAQCARLALAHLVELGHRRVGFVNLEAEALEAGRANAVRLSAELQRAADEKGVALRMLSAPASLDGGRETFREMLLQDPELTAVVSFNERAVPGILAAVHDQGWRVPEDVSLISVDLPPQAADLTMPRMTTVGPSAADMGRAAVGMLIRRLTGDSGPPDQALFDGELHVRGSTAVAPADRSP